MEVKKEKKCLINYATIILFSVVPFLPSLFGDFIFDDAETVVNNPIVNGKDSILQILERDYWGNPVKSSSSHKSYRPVTTFTFWLNHKVHGLDTFGYHLINMLLHSIVSCLVYKFVTNLESVFSIRLRNVAFPSAMLFATHPIHTEAVSNITGRSELLMTMFGLLALLTTKEALFYSFVVLSLFSKEQGITVIPLAMFLQFLSKNRKYFSRKILFSAALVYLRLRINNFESAKFTKFDNPTVFIKDPLFKMVNLIYIWIYNVYLLINPINLCFDYSMGAIEEIKSTSDPRVLSPCILLASTSIIIYFISRNRFLQYFLFLGAFTFFPASNILMTVGFVIAERVLYFPSISICVFASVVYRIFEKRYRNLEIIGISIILLAASGSWNRSKNWRSEIELYGNDVLVCPNNPKIHYNLGKVLRDNGDIDGAKQSYWNAIRLNPSYEQALNNLGNILESSGDSKTAEILLTRAVGIRPTFAAAWMNLAISQMNQNKFGASQKSFENSLKIRKDSPHCYFNLGILYQKSNRLMEALKAWENAVRLHPKHSQAWTNILVLLDSLNMCDKVIKFGHEAIQNLPNSNSIYMQVGTCYAQRNNFEKSERFIKHAISLKPDSSQYRANLGVLYQRFNRRELAIREYQTALELDSDNRIAFSNLHKLNNRTSYF